MLSASRNSSPHTPVMLQEMLEALSPQANEQYLDGTFGAGGYSRALLDAAPCYVRALDRDPTVAPYVELLQNTYGSRFSFRTGCFADMATLCEDITPVDGIVLDIGVSSMQLDTAQRGFSLRYDAPLDMRMSEEGETAANLLARLDATEIADILWRYGEEKASRRIARAIVEQRTVTPITTTGQLRALIHQILPPYKGGDTATRSFQALRIAVNDELEQLTRALHAALSSLKAGGRLIVVTFHSLEDRIVKQFFHSMSNDDDVHYSRHVPFSPDHTPKEPYVTLPKKKAIKPTNSEIANNPRARSSTLRYAIRTNTPYTVGGLDA
jgi:16S rRNA (cytosine1402-N4)-methyltransferase